MNGLNLQSMRKDIYNRGSDQLVPIHMWVPDSEIQGTEKKILLHPIMEIARKEVLKQFKPTKDIALVSLCTKTRPYRDSRKWKKFIKEFAQDCDLIVMSNSGVNPIVFDGCYPYMTYSAHGNKEHDKIYNRIGYYRLIDFFTTFAYKRIIFNFRPTLRDRDMANVFKKHFTKSEIFILPTLGVYEQIKRDGFPSGKMFPDLDERVINQILEHINK